MSEERPLDMPPVAADAALAAHGGHRVIIEHGLDLETTVGELDQLRIALHRVKLAIPDAGPLITTTADGVTRAEFYPPLASEAATVAGKLAREVGHRRRWRISEY